MPKRALSPAYVLSLLRDGIGTLKEIVANLRGAGYTVEARTNHILSDLNRIGLIEEKSPGHFRLTEKWAEVQVVLGLSLRDFVKLSDNGMIVTPTLRGTEKSQEATDVFVAMPFEAGLESVYRQHIKPVIEKLSLKVRRGDDFFAPGSIIEDIWAAIAASKLVVADCTARNPNVFYEIGIAHTLGRPVILLTQEVADLPFDLRHLRYIRYEITSDGMTAFEAALENATKAVMAIDEEMFI